MTELPKASQFAETAKAVRAARIPRSLEEIYAHCKNEISELLFLVEGAASQGEGAVTRHSITADAQQILRSLGFTINNVVFINGKTSHTFDGKVVGTLPLPEGVERGVEVRWLD